MFHPLHPAYSIVGFVITLLIAIWVYRDAEQRGGSNSILWAIGTFFCCPIVPVIYLIVRK